MYDNVKSALQDELQAIRDAGLYKEERIITTPQSAEIETQQGGHVLNFCANNYLGLSSHPEVLAASKATLDTHGFGMSSVRFICGTQDIHKTLEKNVWGFLSWISKARNMDSVGLKTLKNIFINKFFVLHRFLVRLGGIENSPPLP